MLVVVLLIKSVYKIIIVLFFTINSKTIKISINTYYNKKYYYNLSFNLYYIYSYSYSYYYYY